VGKVEKSLWRWPTTICFHASRGLVQ